jgi:hypothetical protein
VPNLSLIDGLDDHRMDDRRLLLTALDRQRRFLDLQESATALDQMGEFGRTPRYNLNAGRDHWGALMSVLLAGGGLKPGIAGASNSKGEVPADAPYRPENVPAMIYRHLGIDPQLTFNDFASRPRYVLEERGLITELL